MKKTIFLKTICCLFTFGMLLFVTSIATAKNENGNNNPVTTLKNASGFIENVGQLHDENHKLRPDIDFKLTCHPGLNIFIGNGKLLYQWNLPGSENNKTGALTFYQMGVELVNANKNAKPTTEDKLAYHENYYTADVNGAVANSYGKITYKNIYPHIDWVINVSGNAGMKYEFIVHPGGNAQNIKLKYNGANTLDIKDDKCIATTDYGTITEEKPYCYTQADNKTVASSFVLGNNKTIGFNIDEYKGTLVIDPSINWGTYFGNPSNTEGFIIVADTLDNTFLCGKTFSTSNIVVSTTASQVGYGGGNSDGYVLKLNAGGSPTWSTYYGAADADLLSAAACDKTTNGVLVAGLTNSPANIGSGILATSGAHQTQNGGTGFSGSSVTDGIVAKFNESGTLIWGTFFGGTQTDWVNSIACDRFGYVYIGGYTESTNGIATLGSFRTAASPGFIEKFSPSGVRQWGTYFNGTVNTVHLDADDNLYFAGVTDSTTGVTTTGSHLASYAGGSTDAFIAKFTNGGTRVWSTYYGGNGKDEILTLVSDSFRNIYVGGYTYCVTGIATTGAFKTTHSAAPAPIVSDAFLAKLSSSGVRQWGTYYGDSIGHDYIKSLSLGPDGKLYVAGATGSPNTIATAGAYQTSFRGPVPSLPGPNPEADLFLLKFTPKGERLWGTYYGGTGVEGSPSCAYGRGRLHIAGTTESTANIATSFPLPTGFQTSIQNPNTRLAFVAQFFADTSVYFKYPYIDTSLCAGDSLKVNYLVTNNFINPINTFKVQLSDSSGNFTATSAIIGSKTDYRQGVINCRIPDTTYEGAKYTLRIIATNPKDTFYNYDVKISIWKYHVPVIYANPNPICENSKLNLDDYNFPYAPDYTWTGPAGFNMPSVHNTFRDTIKMSHAGDYILTANNHGCIGRDTVTVVVNPSPADAYISGDTSLCLGDTMTLNATCVTPGVTYSWIGPYNPPNPIKTSANQNFVIPNVSFADSGYYKVVAILNGVCYSNQEATKRRVTIHPLPKPTAGLVAPLCEHDSIRLTATDTISPVTYSWSGPQGFTSSSKDTTIKNSPIAASGNYIVTTTTIHGCINTGNTIITVKPLPNLVDATNNGPVCSGKTLQLNATNGATGTTYSWTGPGFTSTQQNPSTPALVSGNGVYTVTVDLNGCKLSDTTNVVINRTPVKPLLSSNSPLYIGEILKLNVDNIEVDASYKWTGPNSYTSTAANNALNSVVTSMAGRYYVTSTIANCFDTSSILIEILNKGEKVGPSIDIWPNANNGNFRILAKMETDSDVPMNIYTTDGKLVYTEILKPVNKIVDKQIDLRGRVASGIYRLKIMIDGKMQTYNILIGS